MDQVGALMTHSGASSANETPTGSASANSTHGRNSAIGTPAGSGHHSTHGKDKGLGSSNPILINDHELSTRIRSVITERKEGKKGAPLLCVLWVFKML